MSCRNHWRDHEATSYNEEKEKAIRRGGVAADPLWKERALNVICIVCVLMPYFYSDDVWLKFEEMYGDYATKGTRDIRALWSLMRRAMKQGWCEFSGEYERVQWAHHHYRPIWRSLIYDPTY